MSKKRAVKLILFTAVTAAAVYAVSRKRTAKAAPVTKAAPPAPAAEVPAKKKKRKKIKKSRKQPSVLRTWLLCMATGFCLALSEALFPAVLPILRGKAFADLKNFDETADVQRGVTDRFADLQKELTALLSKEDGDWALWLYDLTEDREFTYNNAQMPSASLMKLFVAGTYFDRVEKDELEYTEYAEDNLYSMLAYSSNDAWARMEEIIGYGNVYAAYGMINDFAESLGCTETGRYIDPYSSNGGNFTSVRDAGLVMKLLYEGNFVSKQCSDTILGDLLQQKYIAKIPAGIPDDEAEVANKTGELIGAENDAAIVYGNKTDYILVIMSDNVNGEKAREFIVNLSGMVFNTMEDKDGKLPFPETPSPAKGTPGEETKIRNS